MKNRILIAGIIVLALVVAFVVINPVQLGGKLPVKKLDQWVLQSNNPSEEFGTYLGNGYIGARISASGEGSNRSSELPCLMSGLCAGEALLPLPDWSNFALLDGKGRRFEIDKKAPYRQTLNMRDGYVKTELTLKSGLQRLTGNVTFIILRPEAATQLGLSGQSAVIRYELTPRWGGQIRLEKSIESVKGDRNWKNVKEDDSSFVGTTPEGVTVYMGTHTTPSGRSIDVKRGEKLVLSKFIGICRDDVQYKTGQATADEATKLGFAKLFAANTQSWRDIWKSDIKIDGDPKSQQAVHAMMFYLISSASPDYSVSPTGLSRNAWSGHVFWDADLWMFPSLLLQHPDLARGIVQYRLQTLNGAMENARKRGLKGAEFAWESARTGRETIGKPFSEERHITSDVAFAQWQYAIAKGEKPIDVIAKCADYWASRAKLNSKTGKYEILGVLPPDEYQEKGVNNSVYTNATAKTILELSNRGDIASKMYIPFDAKYQRFIEFDGYKDEMTKQADTELLIYPWGYPMTQDVKRNTYDFYKTKTDPKGPAMTSSIHSIIAAELDRPDEAYQQFEASYQDFMRGPFMLFNEKRSKYIDNMCFMTGCGGSLQSVLYGFAGLRIGKQPEGFKQSLPDLYIKPCLPPKWKKLEITNIKWRGKTYNLSVTQGNNWVLN